MGRGPSIEGRKNAEDARKGKLFTKLIREITVASRQGADPAANPRLRAAIDKALTSNMTKDTVERAVRRGSGADGVDHMVELRYEGYGPSGVALIIDCMTDNQQRTVADVRHALSKHGGNLGTNGSVAFQFTRLGEIVVAAPDAVTEEKIFEVALEGGADDVVAAAGFSTVSTSVEQFESVRQALLGAGFKPERADLLMRPNNRVAVEGEAEEDLRDLLDRLEGLDDVQEVYHNAAISD